MTCARRAFAFTLVLTLSGCAVNGPPVTAPGSWSAVTRLPPATQVRVWWFDPTLANLPKHRLEGPLVAADDTTITVGTATGPQRLVRAQVYRVDAAPPKRRADSLANGTLIGGLVGGGVLAAMARENTTSDPLPYPAALLVVGGGLAVGALMDAATKGYDYRTLYMSSEPGRR